MDITPPLDAASRVHPFWKQLTRPDGRLLSQTRQSHIQFNGESSLSSLSTSATTNHVLGSALVTMGHSRILGAVTYQIGTIPVGGKGGDVVVTISSSFSSSSSLALLKQDTLQAILQRLLEETLETQEQLSLSHVLSMPKQQQQQQSLALRLHVTLQILNHDGNLLDAALLTSMAALHNTHLPNQSNLQYQSDSLSSGKGGTVVVVRPDATTSSITSTRRPFLLPVVPVALTLGIYKNDNSFHWIADPTSLEEAAGTEGSLTVVVDAISSSILALEFSSPTTSISDSQLALAMKMAEARAQQVASLLGVEPSNDDNE